MSITLWNYWARHIPEEGAEYTAEGEDVTIFWRNLEGVMHLLQGWVSPGGTPEAMRDTPEHILSMNANDSHVYI